VSQITFRCCLRSLRVGGESIYKAVMNDATKRSIARWVHLVFSIPVLGYVYSPFEELPNYAPIVRFVAIPMIALTGLWMWKGHLLRRLVSRRAA
jgi:glucose-6-phosphate-specific signal transduction histidine kinase